MENSQRPAYLFLGIYILSLQCIMTEQVNVALKGIATQPTTWNNMYSSNLAIDGNANPDVAAGSCSHTQYQNNPWWRVDLLAVYDITNVIITNRIDCCTQWINGAEIHIGNSLVNNGNENPRCVVIPSMAAGATVNYTCNMIGRYVNVFLPGPSKALVLCEVQVYVIPIVRRFLRLKFNSSEDLTNPTMKDKVLQKMKSASAHSSGFQLSWKKEPELEN